MKLTIFAATGGIGRQLLEQAIAAGHDVTAVVRERHSFRPGAAVHLKPQHTFLFDPASGNRLA